MTRIPPVRLWKVTALNAQLRPIDSVFVHAINRRFARWNARDAYPSLFYPAFSVRAYPIPEAKHAES